MCVCVQVRRTLTQSPTMPEELLEGKDFPCLHSVAVFVL